MKNFGRGAFILLALVLMLTPMFTACTTEAETTTVAPIVFKVGFIGPLSGSGPSAVDYANGSKLAAEHINQDGGLVVNGQKYIVEWKAYDTRFDPKVSVAMARKMVEDGVKLCHSVAIEAYLADQEITEAAKIITVAPGFEDFARPDIKYSFPDSYAQWMGQARHMICAPTGEEDKYTIFKNVNKVAIVAEQIPFVEKMTNGWIEANEIAGNKIEIVYDARVPSDLLDFSSIINAIKAKKPDLVLCHIGIQPSQLAIYRQFRAAGLNVQILDSDNIVGHEASVRMIASDAAIGVVENMYYIPKFISPVPEWAAQTLGFDPAIRDRYINDIIAQYGEEMETQGAANGYDQMYAMLKNVEWSGDPMNPDAIVAQIEKEVPVAGVCAGNLWWKEDHMRPLPILLVRITDINNETGEFSIEHLGGGRSLSYYTDVDWANKEFNFSVGKQIDCSQK